MDYIPVLLLLLVGLGVGLAVLILSHFLGPKNPSARKDSPFECGVPPSGTTKRRFSVRFYLIAILFLLFDVEVVFFYPWAVVFKKYLSINNFILFEMVFFVAVLLVGYIYIFRKGALEWE
jgi:NADH-quinone oxidoreductase subunit A